MKTLLIALLLLIGVQAHAETLKYPSHRNVMQIRWESDPVKVQKAVDEWNHKHFDDVEAVAYWKGNRCTIYALEPDYDMDLKMILLGHEALHCFRGSFHKN